jgi:hypothetical protein
MLISEVELNLKVRVGHYLQLIYMSTTIKFEQEGAVTVKALNFRKDSSEMHVKCFRF